MFTNSMCLPGVSTCFMGRRRRVFPTGLDTYYRYTNNSKNRITISCHEDDFTSFSTFGSRARFGGLHYKWTRTSKNLSVPNNKEEEAKCGFKKGDIVNLSELLFTKNRDYLIRYNDPELVTADHLAGKFIVIYFVPLHPDIVFVEDFTMTLMDTYNDLKFKNCFEVVLVVVDDVSSFDRELGDLSPDPSLEGEFEDQFSQMPWVAIPFSDIASRKLLKRRFGHFRRLFKPEEVLIDPTGMVLHTRPQSLFQTYGSVAYPFSDERIAFLKSEDKTTIRQPSLKALLGSSERDFVISNNGNKVPIHTLEGKVVALLFYEYGSTPSFLLNKLKMYYEVLAKNNQNFEVVLLYVYDTYQTICSISEEKFWNTFKTMPWLALPYKDPVHKKLQRLFCYPNYRWSYNPRLVIVGPHRDIIEPGAATVLKGYYEATLLMREKFAKVEAERVGELKLDMMCGPNTVFRRKDGSQVQFSQLAGKRIIFLFEGDFPEYDGADFLKCLKESYMQMKGTADEFEVIYLPNNNDECCHGERVADVPWLVSRIVELVPGSSAILSFYGKCYNRYQSSFLLAFDGDGSLVRRTICPVFGDIKFPFYVDSVQIEAFDIGYSEFCWGYWDTLYQGLLRYSNDQINFPSGDLLFSVYSY